MRDDAKANRADASSGGERLKRYKERLFELAALGLPIALINGVLDGIKGVLVSQAWHVLGFLAPLVVVAWLLWRRVIRLGALRVRGAVLLFLVCYISAFTVAAGVDLLVWKRSTVAFENEAQLPRNWLAPAGWGDWRYRFVRSSQPLESLLVVLTIEQPADTMTRDAVRFEVARLIQLAVNSRARGIALDFYFGKEPSEVDSFLCDVVREAGIPVIAGQRVVAEEGNQFFERYAEFIDPCFPDTSRGQGLAYRDADGVIRHVALVLPKVPESHSFSLKVATALDSSLEPPDGSLLQFVESKDRRPPLEYERFARQSPDHIAGTLRGRFVLVGERSTSETFRTPFGDRLGVEVHAAAIGSLLTGDWIERPPWFSGLVITLAACYLIVALAAARIAARKILLTTLAFSALFMFAAALAMRLWLVWLDVVYTLVAVWLLVGLTLALRKRIGSADTVQGRG